MTKKVYVALGVGVMLVVVALFVRGARQASRTAISASSGAGPQWRVATPFEVAEVIYDGKLAAGWEDWGWGPHELPKSGPAKIVFGGYGGIALHHSQLPSRFAGLSFRYKAPADWPDFLVVSVKRTGSPESAFPRVAVTQEQVAKLADGWSEVFIDWHALDPASLPVELVSIAARAVVTSEPVLLDKIVLTKPASSAALGPAPKRDVELAVLCRGTTQPINPLIYGSAQGDWTSGQSAQRIGGNTTSRLNWDVGNIWNSGSDWFFENVRGDGAGVWAWIDAGVAQNVQTALTVPMIGWVAKDATSVGFPWSKISGQRKRDPNRPEAGDGFRPDGSVVRPGPATETSVAAPPEVIGRWIRTIVEKDRVRGKRSVQMYILDNEPSLWNQTHRDVHPEALTYDELLDRTIRYGTAIRQADPDAVIAGPAEWGWSGYLFSAKDREAGWVLQPDRRAHGGVPLIPWYLQRLAEYEKSKGVRLLDVLDVHFYPAADGLFGSNARTDPEGAELRLRSTRALWDPDYLDESWIKDSVQLIPRLKQWVSENYPGRKLSIGEWSFGADDHISGGLATAEALGRFGQQGLDAAFFYGGPKAGTPVFWAFRAYRNFDGNGGRFQDFSVPTREADKVSFFASRDGSGAHLVTLVLNRDPVFAVKARIDTDACGRRSSLRVFSYGPRSRALAEEKASAAQGDATSVVVVQPYSFALLDMAMEPGR